MMTLRENMIQVAARGASISGDRLPAMRAFLAGCRTANGGFADRAGRVDLYYTLFGIEAARALGERIEAEKLLGFLADFGDGHWLDLVHVCCLARLWADAGGPAVMPGAIRKAILKRLHAHRAAAGGFANHAGVATPTTFATFFAVNAHDDLGEPIPNGQALLDALAPMQRGPAWANDAEGIASTPATAAACMLHAKFAQVPEGLVEWLCARQTRDGGFQAADLVPIGDLLTTGVCLHALAAAGAPLRPPACDDCRQFVQSLETIDGGFQGSVADPSPDTEYLFYGLLAMGHLSSPSHVR